MLCLLYTSVTRSGGAAKPYQASSRSRNVRWPGSGWSRTWTSSGTQANRLGTRNCKGAAGGSQCARSQASKPASITGSATAGSFWLCMAALARACI